jgi:Skp family chaperone for outer membrane proteins
MVKFLTLALLFLVTGLRAETGLSLAVVDMTKVFAGHPSTPAATKELTEARDASRESFKEKSNALKEVLQQHQELIRAGKREEAAEALKSANEIEKAIATLRTTELRDLEEKFREAKTKIMDEIRVAIGELNADGRYAMIFDLSSASSNGLPQVLHAPGATDITTEVIAFVKEKAKTKMETPKP